MLGQWATVTTKAKDDPGVPRLLDTPETLEVKRREEIANAIVRRLDTDRKKVGMKTAEMYHIAESRGVDDLRAEIDRRLETLESSTGGVILRSGR